MPLNTEFSIQIEEENMTNIQEENLATNTNRTNTWKNFWTNWGLPVKTGAAGFILGSLIDGFIISENSLNKNTQTEIDPILIASIPVILTFFSSIVGCVWKCAADTNDTEISDSDTEGFTTSQGFLNDEERENSSPPPSYASIFDVGLPTFEDVIIQMQEI